MKSVLRLMLWSVLCVAPVSAQQQAPEMVTIPKSALTEYQKEELATAAMDNRIQTYGKWVGVGKEIGEAVNSSLEAVSTNASKFAETSVGRTAVYLVVWKVVGKDVLGLIVGGLLLLIGVPLWIWSYRNALQNRYPVDTETFNEKGGVASRTYKFYKTDRYGNKEDASNDAERFIHFAALALLLVIAMLVAL